MAGAVTVTVTVTGRKKKGPIKKTDGYFISLDWTGLAGDGGYGTGRGRLLAFEPVWSGAKGAGRSVYGMVVIVTVSCYVVKYAELSRCFMCVCSVPGCFNPT